MKKLLSILALTMSLTMLLAACGSKDDNISAGDNTVSPDTEVSDTVGEPAVPADAVVETDEAGNPSEIKFYDGTTVTPESAGLTGQVVMLGDGNLTDETVIEIKAGDKTLHFDPNKSVKEILTDDGLCLIDVTPNTTVTAGGSMIRVIGMAADAASCNTAFEIGAANMLDVEADFSDLYLDYVNLVPSDNLVVQGLVYNKDVTFDDFVTAWGEPAAAYAKYVESDGTKDLLSVYVWRFVDGWLVWNTYEVAEYNHLFAFREDTFLTDYILGLSAIMEACASEPAAE